MRTDNDINLPLFQAFQGFIFLLCRPKTIEIRDIYGKVFQPFLKTPIMLECEYGCRHEYRNLLTIGCSFECRTNSHFGFTKAHISTDEPVHHGFGFHIFFYFYGSFLLVGRIFIDKAGFKLVLKIGIGGKSKALGSLSLCIEFYQVKGNLLYLCLGLLF